MHKAIEGNPILSILIPPSMLVLVEHYVKVPSQSPVHIVPKWNVPKFTPKTRSLPYLIRTVNARDNLLLVVKYALSNTKLETYPTNHPQYEGNLDSPR